MKCVALFVVLLLTVIVVQDADSAWFIGRLGVRCRWSCPRACSHVFYQGGLRLRCGISCRFSCSGKKKRAMDPHVTPLPSYFEFYDIDENNLVSQEEFVATLGSVLDDDTDLSKAFNMTDTDQNGSLTEKELFSSTCLVFENSED